MDKKQYSFYLSRALDTLGYSYQCIKQRQKSWRHCGVCLTADEKENVSDMIAGSKADGISRVFESDFDLMVSLDDFICSQNEIKIEEIEKGSRPGEMSVTNNNQPELSAINNNQPGKFSAAKNNQQRELSARKNNQSVELSATMNNQLGELSATKNNQPGELSATKNNQQGELSPTKNNQQGELSATKNNQQGELSATKNNQSIELSLTKSNQQGKLSAIKNTQFEDEMNIGTAETFLDRKDGKVSGYMASIKCNFKEARKSTTSIDDKVNKLETNISHEFEKTSHVKYSGIFQLCTENVLPGYAILKVLYLNEQKLQESYVQENQAFVNSVIKINGTSMLSSTHFREFAYKCDEDEFTQTVDGPAGTSLADPYHGGVCDVDSVFCIPCVCKSVNQAWVNRHRKFSWPSNELINEISGLDGHVVPVGSKKSKTSDIEWRICFTMSEVKLVHSFNEAQLKLYTLIKMVGKALFKPICSDISSYILKNIALWMAEKIPLERYKVENLYGLLIVALKFLRYSIVKRSLPNYMIPNRNLFFAKISMEQKQNLMKVLDFILDDDSFFISKFEELNFLVRHMAICLNESKLAFYMERNREQFEKIFSENWRDIWEFRTPDFLNTCTKQCNCLNALLQICDLLKVSSKTRNCAIEKMFWWITGKMGVVPAIDGRTSRSTCWFWNEAGEILPLFMQDNKKLNAYRVFIDSRDKEVN